MGTTTINQSILASNSLLCEQSQEFNKYSNLDWCFVEFYLRNLLISSKKIK